MSNSFLSLRGILAGRRLLVLGAAGLAGLFALQTAAGGAIDHVLQTARDGARAHDASGAVVVLEIDARSLTEIDRWPWPRSIHGAVVDELVAGGAKGVAFDVDFSATSTPAEDAAFAKALDRAGGDVVLPTFRQAAGADASGYIDSFPAKAFKDKGFLAAVNVVPDADGYVRRMPLGVETGGLPRPSLAAMVAEHDAEIGQDFRIDFAIDPTTIPRISVGDLIAGRIPVSAIAGKRFIIGATAIEMGDRYAVPNHGVIPGVVIQAMAAETLLEGGIPIEVGGAAALFLTLLLTTLTIGRRGDARAGLAFAAAFAILLAAPLLAEMLFNLTIATGAALCAAVAAAVAASAIHYVRRFRERALIDLATGLPNLAALEQNCAGQAPLVVVARIDRFAAIASGLGPEGTCNLVLRVADRLRFHAEVSDIYRIDDGSLAWVETGGSQEVLERKIEAIATLMRSPVECGRLVDVTLNMGVAQEDGADPKQIVANASLAALHAAKSGKRWERFNAADSEETNWHLSLLGELDAAMACGQVWNAYQPKLDLATGEIIGAEALVRWLHPERGAIAPDSFIPMVEGHGRARDLTEHVLGQALEDARYFEQCGYPIGIAVNVSATLLADHEFIEIVAQRLLGSGIPTSRITIEVTESATMNGTEHAIAALESWRATGVNISIDDYGTGQSSLGYLQKLPASELKIDKSFVQSITSDPRDEIMVRSTVKLAHELGMKVVAEGIEDAECLAMLASLGCDTAQGYYIAKPMPAEALAQFLEARLRHAA